MTNYPSNASDSQWAIISKKFDITRSRRYDLREIWNGICYLVKTGCQWRLLPGDFPDWRIVYYYFSSWSKAGIIEELHDQLLKKSRKKANRKVQPSVGVIDSQSVKNTLVSSEEKGYDAGKRIKGIKRHVIVDTIGSILAVEIQSGSVQDRDGAYATIEALHLKWKHVKVLYADGGYRGKLIDRIKKVFNIQIKIVKTKDLPTFSVLPKRWIVERTFAWMETNRRNAKNYERLRISCMAIIRIAAIRIMLARF